MFDSENSSFLPVQDLPDTDTVAPDTQLPAATPDWTPFVERWEHALQVLLDIPPQERESHLNMEMWGVQTPCGTVACLGGHCSLNPWFRAQGFTSEFKKHPESGEMELQFTGIDPEDFFGSTGFNFIFMATGLKYDELVTEVREQIAYLKAGGNPNGYEGFVLVYIGQGDDDSVF